MERCEECGFAYDLSLAPDAGAEIVNGAGELVGMVTAAEVDALSRRSPETWSPLEYACHVRDMLLVQRERVLLARRRDRPSLEPMGREERVEHDGYAEQNVADVARQLTDAARLFANVLARLGEDGWDRWDRTVMYNYPSRSERSLRWVAVHTLHEVRHHTFDISRQLSVRSRSADAT